MIYWWRWFEGQSWAALGTPAQEKDSSAAASPPPPLVTVLTERSQSGTLADTRTIEKLLLLFTHVSFALLRTDLRLINLYFFVVVVFKLCCFSYWGCKPVSWQGHIPWAKGKSLCETSAHESSTNLSLAKTKLSTEKGNAAGAVAKAAAWNGAVPDVVNWNVLETALPPALLPCPGGSTKQEYGSQIVSWWLFDLAVWAGRNQLCRADVGCAGVLACCTLSLSSWADQAYGDKMAGRPQALGLGERKLFAWKAGSEVFGKNSPKAPKMDEYVREGAWHKAAGKHLWTIMPALCYGRGMAWHMKGSRNWQSLGLLVKWIMMLSLEGASPHISKEKRWASLGSCCELVWAIKRP